MWVPRWCTLGHTFIWRPHHIEVDGRITSFVRKQLIFPMGLTYSRYITPEACVLHGDFARHVRRPLLKGLGRSHKNNARRSDSSYNIGHRLGISRPLWVSIYICGWHCIGSMFVHPADQRHPFRADISLVCAVILRSGWEEGAVLISTKYDPLL